MIVLNQEEVCELSKGGFMKNKKFNRFYLLSVIGVFIASYYPLSMGVRVITDMIADGIVEKENYPKYIIPYTPISIAIILGVILMPLFIRLFKKYAFAFGAVTSTGVFFLVELLFENKVVVSASEVVAKLEDWQMFMCAIPPDSIVGIWDETATKTVPLHNTKTAIEILMGEYNPAFKLHFYLISVVLIITILNCFYGFASLIKTGEKKRLKSLIIQSVCSVSFLGLCIFACFTAFFRDGNIEVSLLSATLMAVFFILFGVTVGVFVGTFLLKKRKLVSAFIPSVIASIMTLLMYIGEMILLSGNLYSFGSGFMFESIKGIVLAPVDLLIIVASGCVTAVICLLITKNKMND